MSQPGGMVVPATARSSVCGKAVGQQPVAGTPAFWTLGALEKAQDFVFGDTWRQ